MPAPTGSTTDRRVFIRRPPASARGTIRRRGLSVFLRLRDVRLRGVQVKLRRGGRTVLSGSARRLDRSARVRLKLRRKPRPGLYTVVLTARDASGDPVRVTRRVRLRR